MRVFLYEWITGGGLVEHPGALPETLLCEGTAMLSAVAADLAAIEQCQVTVLRDIRLDKLPLDDRETETIEVHSRSHQQDQLQQQAAQADHTLVIAPEFDGILLDANSRVREAGGQLLAADSTFVELAGDKHRTAERLAAAGIPVPEGVLLPGDEETLPGDFPYPGVLKPVCGAGSQHTLLVSSPTDEPPPYPWPRRLERFCRGTAVSVSFLCGPAGRVALPPCRQHLSSDGRFTYRGGSIVEEPDLARRAAQLAERAIELLQPNLGYVGVDLILGPAADGSEDMLIEVNPRITTSYVGLRAAAQDNLAQALLDLAAGRPATPRFRPGPLQFESDGTVRQPMA